MQREMDFFYFIGSTYSYLSVVRAQALADQAGIVLRWRPFSVRTLMREQNNVPFATKPVKMQYMWRDIERRAARFGIAFAGIAPYPVDSSELANHVATLAAGEGWCMAFTQAAYRAWFLDKQDPGSPQTLRSILTALGRNADACLAQASDARIRQAYEASTDQARQLGLFGSPTFVVGREVFWGDDRLEDAIDWCKSH
ncbi:MAG: 2-hydroxychromene-2-carboxylate isomerase [Rhodoferax sp.]|nr:2-hydroxychromene-2-carboxylate isomerase [Rhodoferax sp.]